MTRASHTAALSEHSGILIDYESVKVRRNAHIRCLPSRTHMGPHPSRQADVYSHSVPTPYLLSHTPSSVLPGPSEPLRGSSARNFPTACHVIRPLTACVSAPPPRPMMPVLPGPVEPRLSRPAVQVDRALGGGRPPRRRFGRERPAPAHHQRHQLLLPGEAAALSSSGPCDVVLCVQGTR